MMFSKSRILAFTVIMFFAKDVMIAYSQEHKILSFEVATVKQAPPSADSRTGNWSLPGIGVFRANNVSLSTLIQLAYDVNAGQVVNRPDWFETELYTVEAKPEQGIKLTREELQPRLQSLLAERFHLVIHRDTQRVHGFALEAPRGNQHLTPTTKPDFPGDFLNISPGHMSGFHWTMTELAKFLSRPAGFPVVDQTGISGRYDIDFQYNPKPDAESQFPPLEEALKASSGLVLKPRKVSVPVIVIDGATKVPISN